MKMNFSRIKKTILMVLILTLSAALFGCVKENNGTPQNNDEVDKNEITSLVQGFGERLKMVPLMASKEIADKSIDENYSSFVIPELLAKWKADPLNAPGRIVSSPWPDSIEEIVLNKVSENEYEVKGIIVEMTSQEIESGGFAAKRPITLKVVKTADSWRISEAAMGDYLDSGPIKYENAEYGFDFLLPENWKGYTIVYGNWQGRALEGAEAGKVVETGPIVSIRHPKWTEENKRQDIPIMIFTLDQWELVQEENISLGAAPIPPSELGRNDRYVFALPARYNYEFPIGFEEVEEILKSNPLHAF